MKTGWGVVIAVLLVAGLAAAQEGQAPKGQKEKLSYSLGMEIGNSLKRQPAELDIEFLLKGLKDTLSGGKTVMTEQEARETVIQFQKEMIAKQKEAAKTLGDKNKKEGDVFLEENKKKEGVTTLPSGLQYKILKPGGGKKPKLTDSVTVHYKGTLIDGTEFDSSYSRGEPASFPVKGVIPGWSEALQLMDEGAKWQLVIPPQLGYGERGAGAKIGPNATLVFEVELIKVQ